MDKWVKVFDQAQDTITNQYKSIEDPGTMGLTFNVHQV